MRYVDASSRESFGLRSGNLHKNNPKMLKVINKRKCLWCGYEFDHGHGTSSLISHLICPRCHAPFTRKLK